MCSKLSSSYILHFIYTKVSVTTVRLITADRSDAVKRPSFFANTLLCYRTHFTCGHINYRRVPIYTYMYIHIMRSGRTINNALRKCYVLLKSQVQWKTGKWHQFVSHRSSTTNCFIFRFSCKYLSKSQSVKFS